MKLVIAASLHHATELQSKMGYVVATKDLYPELHGAELTKALINLVGRILILGCSTVVEPYALQPDDKIRWEAVATAFDAELEWLPCGAETVIGAKCGG